MTGGLVLLCGRSFSGKSTVAASLANSLPGRVISLHQINEERELRGGEGIPLSEWARTNELARDRVIAQLRDDQTVIVDDTSSPRFLRDGWRALSLSVGSAMVLVYVDTSMDLICQRLMDNRLTGQRGDVIDEVMAAHQKSFEPPEEDEQALCVGTNSGPIDLAGLAAEVRSLLKQ